MVLFSKKPNNGKTKASTGAWDQGAPFRDELCNALFEQDVSQLQKLLKTHKKEPYFRSSISFNHRLQPGNSQAAIEEGSYMMPVEIAAKMANKTMFSMLEKAGAHIDESSREYLLRSQILASIEQDSVDGLQNILKKNKKIDVDDVFNNQTENPLEKALKKENVNKKIVDLLIKAGAKPNAEALCLAIGGDNKDLATKLINQAEDYIFNWQNEKGKTPLDVAIEAKKTDMLEVILVKGSFSKDTLVQAYNTAQDNDFGQDLIKRTAAEQNITLEEKMAAGVMDQPVEKKQDIVEAAKQGNISRLAEILVSDTTISKYDLKAAVGGSVDNDQHECLDKLLAYAQDNQDRFEKSDFSGALVSAIEGKKQDSVDKLFNMADLNEGPFCVASSMADPELLKRMLDTHTITPETFARALDGRILHENNRAFLLESMPDEQSCYKAGLNASLRAEDFERAESIDSKIKDKSVLDQLLIEYVGEGKAQQVEKLLKMGAKPNGSDPEKTTPLHVAIEKSYQTTKDNTANILEQLHEHGADINAKDRKGNTPLHLAAAVEHEQILKFLLEKGADKEAKNHEGKTPLHVAAKKGYTTGLNLLADAGGDVNALDNEGKTPLHMTVEDNGMFKFHFGKEIRQSTKIGEWKDCAESLLSKKAKPIEDKFGDTPMDLAITNKLPEITEVFQNSGFNAAPDAGMTVVPEYETYATNNPNEQIATASVNKCLVLVISNADEQGKVSHRSVSHLPMPQTWNKEVLKKAAIPAIIDEYQKIGGDLSQASFDIYGGNGGNGVNARTNLKDALIEVMNDQVVNVQEPDFKTFLTQGNTTLDLVFAGTQQGPKYWLLDQIERDGSVSNLKKSETLKSDEQVQALAERIKANTSITAEMTTERVGEDADKVVEKLANTKYSQNKHQAQEQLHNHSKEFKSYCDRVKTQRVEKGGSAAFSRDSAQAQTPIARTKSDLLPGLKAVPRGKATAYRAATDSKSSIHAR